MWRRSLARGCRASSHEPGRGDRWMGRLAVVANTSVTINTINTISPAAGVCWRSARGS